MNPLPFETLRATLGCSISDELLQLAFTHPSAAQSGQRTQSSNQRLEFLGDALVGAVVAAQLYALHPNRPEGELTQLKIALVRRETLARAAQRFDLGKFLVLSAGEEKNGGRKRESILSDVFESVTAAVFLTGGWQVTCDWVMRALGDEFSSVETSNPKNLLQERTQAIGLGTPSYITNLLPVRHKTPQFAAEVLLKGEVRGQGTGRTKQEAEMSAAQMALVTLSALEGA